MTHPDTPDDDTPPAPPPAQVLIDETDAAIYLTKHVSGVDPPTPAVVQRWRTRIRVWAHRERVTRHGTPGRGMRRYDLRELETLAKDSPPVATGPVEHKPMTTVQRAAAYLAQTGKPTLTVRQARQVRRKYREGETAIDLVIEELRGNPRAPIRMAAGDYEDDDEATRGLVTTPPEGTVHERTDRQ